MKLRAHEVMTKEVRTARPDMTLTELDELLLDANVGGAPVVEEDGRLVGIVSRHDVIQQLYDEQREAQRVSGFYTSPFPIPIPALEKLAKDSRKMADHMTKLRVRDVMTRAPRTVAPDDDLRSIARLMAGEGIHRLPVVADDRLVGIVSSLDLVRVLAKFDLAAL